MDDYFLPVKLAGLHLRNPFIVSSGPASRNCNAIELSGDVATVKEERCIGCSICVDICPRGAIEMTPLPHI